MFPVFRAEKEKEEEYRLLELQYKALIKYIERTSGLEYHSGLVFSNNREFKNIRPFDAMTINQDGSFTLTNFKNHKY
jgi:hypothetical protein